jgi:hypothetical protein
VTFGGWSEFALRQPGVEGSGDRLVGHPTAVLMLAHGDRQVVLAPPLGAAQLLAPG